MNIMLTKNTWNQIITTLRSDIPPSEFTTWFSDTTLLQLEPELAIVRVTNKFSANWLKDNYLKNIQRSFKENLNFIPKIHFIYEQPTAKNEIRGRQQETPSCGNFSNRLDPLSTFDNFITGSCNKFTYSSALEAADGPSNLDNPLYIFSELASGKTHLLHAIGNHMLKKNPLMRAMYLSADRFSTDYSLAAKNRTLDQFRRNYRLLDCILLDDLDLLGARNKSQEELVSLFDSFYGSNKRIVIAGKAAPGQIKDLNPRFRSRLGWGLVSKIDLPDQQTKLKIIRAKAEEFNTTIRDDVVFFLANATNDLKTLIQYLVALQTHQSLYRNKIDLSSIKSIIQNKQFSSISVREIQKVSSEYFNISLSDLLSNKKTRKFSYPRQVAIYLSRKLTDSSLKEIGRMFNNKDHSTIIYSVRRIKNMKANKREIQYDINKIEDFFFRNR